MIPLLALTLGLSAQADDQRPTGDIPQLVFAPDQPVRLYVEQRVQLPAAMWFYSDFNRDVRVNDYHLAMVMDCTPDEVGGRTELSCDIVDSAVAGHPFEMGRLAYVTEELEQKLTGAQLHLRFSADGGLRMVDLEGARNSNRRSRRINRMNENLRLMVKAAVAGLTMPRGQHPELMDAWATPRTDLVVFPSPSGMVSSQLLEHVAHAAPGSDNIVVRSRGEGLAAPVTVAESVWRYEMVFASAALYDPEQKMLVERLWRVHGTPTASNPLASGFVGVPYYAEGHFRVLEPNEWPLLFESGEY